MKSKKLLLLLILAILLAAGWILAVRAAAGVDVLKEQRELVADADAFAERELYVRAIALYEEALRLNTGETAQVEEKLLNACRMYGDMDSYTALVEKRISLDRASEAEYLEAARHYMEVRDIESAASVLQKGIAKFDSGTLKDYYEENRYAYMIRTTDYETILPTGSNTLMPAFDGEKWGYVNERGREELPFVYDKAVAFNAAGYAAVLLDGVYYTILANGDRYGADDGSSYEKMTDVLMMSGSRVLGQRNGSYSYFNYDFAPIAEGHQYSAMTGNACGVAAVQKDGKWGIITDAGERVVDFILEDVAVNSLGCAFAGDRAMVKENGRWHLIDTEGNFVGSATFAGAKAPESAGFIAVSDESGYWGFANREGEQVIACEYKDALSFSQHLAAVQIVDEWNYISEQNQVAIEQPFVSAQPFHNGVAQAGLLDGTALITLDYFEENE